MKKKYGIIIVVVVWILGIGFGGCTDRRSRTEKVTKPIVQQAKKAVPKTGSALYLAQAQFLYEKADDGTEKPVPGPARLVIYIFREGTWHKEVLEDPDSNVFHKAAWFKPIEGEPGILTIGAQQAFLKIWRKKNGKWIAESLWNPHFGGSFDRLRDFEVGDVTGDGIADIVIATHDQGVVAVVSWNGKRYEAKELCRKPDTFIHEIELGDVDGDGVTEIFCTPSKPNKLDGSIQPGEVDMWAFENGSWNRQKVDILKSRHAKEILCVTLPGDKTPTLFASLEGEKIGSEAASGDTTRIRMYKIPPKGTIIHRDIASLPGQLCRFLTYADTDGDGNPEIIASTSKNGIWKLTPPENPFQGKWRKDLIATGTSGFEHATYPADLDGDGRAELYVASDNQRELRCYRYSGAAYQADIIDTLKDDTITFNITAVSGN